MGNLHGFNLLLQLILFLPCIMVRPFLHKCSPPYSLILYSFTLSLSLHSLSLLSRDAFPDRSSAGGGCHAGGCGVHVDWWRVCWSLQAIRCAPNLPSFSSCTDHLHHHPAASVLVKWLWGGVEWVSVVLVRRVDGRAEDILC